MSMQITDRILAPARGSAAELKTALGGSALTNGYADALYGPVADAGLDPAVLAAQSDEETAHFTSGYAAIGNFAGIGITFDGQSSPFTLAGLPPYDRGYQGAIVQAAVLYARLRPTEPLPTSLQPALDHQGIDGLIAGVQSLFRQYPTSVATIDDLNKRFGPNDHECTWACDPEYQDLVVQHGNALFPSLGAQEADVADFKNPTFIVIAGHQGQGDSGGGDGLEKKLTPALADAYVAALTKAGYQAIRIKDGNPNGLDGASQDLAATGENTPGNLVILDIHYEGPDAEGVFAIYPRSNGLTTAIQVEGQGNDVQGSNPLDEQFGLELATQIARATGLGLRQSGVMRPGLMGEQQTGVGLDGYRLATFAYTAPLQPRAIRLVVEHGAIGNDGDKQIILRDDFTGHVTEGVVAAVQKLFPLDGQTPAKPPKPTLAKPKSFPKSDGLDHGQFKAIDRLVHAGPKGAKLRQFGGKDAPESGKALKPGDTIAVVFKAGSWWIAVKGHRIHEDEIVEKVTFNV